VDLEKRKKGTGHPDVKTSASQVLLAPTPDEKQAKDLIADQVFCVECKTYHSEGLKGRLLCHIRRLFT